MALTAEQRAMARAAKKESDGASATAVADPAAAAPEVERESVAVVTFLTMGRWNPVIENAEQPITVDTMWIHQVKSMGQPMPASTAYAFEERARDSSARASAEAEFIASAPDADLGPDISAEHDDTFPPSTRVDDSGSGDDPELDNPFSGFTPKDNKPAAGDAISGYATASKKREIETRSEIERPMNQETDQLNAAAAADADARAQAIARAEEEHKFAHDNVGGVMIWTCYACGISVRYNEQCECRRCRAINDAKGSCPKCGSDSPHSNGPDRF